jgi:UDP-glucuronate 4-epimerase
MKILVTGAAGFIGHRTTQKLSEIGHDVYAIDNLNEYYDVKLKLARLKEIGIEPFCQYVVQSSKFANLRFKGADICDAVVMERIFRDQKFDCVINLAAQAGVRYSIDHPETYITTNVVGFYNILDLCRKYDVKHLVYASSSSVYGDRPDGGMLFESDQCETPKSLYAATKKTDELLAYSYSEIYGLPTTGLRFFTVYGEYGRPDMSPMIFANAIEKGEPIKVFNNGQMYRDFTYIDDVVGAIVKTIDRPSEDNVPYRIYNVGNANPILLTDFIETLEQIMGKTANKIMMPMQKGDVTSTNASTYRICYDLGWTSHTKIETGLRKFVDWFRSEKNPIAG